MEPNSEQEKPPSNKPNLKGQLPKGIYPRLTDVFGDEEFKTKLEDIVLGIQNENLYRVLGGKPPKSFLFHGKTGTGKTFGFDAIANEYKATLPEGKHVLVLPYNIGEVGTAYINMGSVNLQTFFDVGRDSLCNTNFAIQKVMYWFDECDVLMGHRGGTHSKEDDKLLETLMKNLQAINDRDAGEYVFFSTNFPEALDKASIRSGRIDEKLEFKLPSYDSRLAAFKGYVTKADTLAKYRVFRGIQYDDLAKESDGFNFADISTCIENTITRKIKKEIRRKPKGIIPAYWIPHRDVLASVRDIKDKNYNTKEKSIGFSNS